VTQGKDRSATVIEVLSTVETGTSPLRRPSCQIVNQPLIYLASADAAIFFSQLTATISASLSLIRPPLSFVNWHESTM